MANINKAENGLPDQLRNRIAALEQQMLQLKAANQPIGADILSVDTVPATHIVTSTGSIAANGNFVNLTLTLDPGLSKGTLVNFLTSMYIDTIDAAHLWPNGSSLTSGGKACQFFPSDDEVSYDPNTGIHKYIIVVINYDLSVAHTFYITNRMIIPKSSGAGAS